MEENKLLETIKKAKSDDKDAIEEILSAFNETVEKIFTKYFNDIKGLDVDEIKQQGRLAILDAIKSFDESKDIQFSTYVSVCIRNKMINEVKKVARRLSMIYETPIDEVDEEGNPTFDIPSSVNTLNDIVYHDMLDRFKDTMEEVLTDDEKKVLKGFLENKEIKEIAEELGITEKNVHNAKDRIKKKIVKYLF